MSTKARRPRRSTRRSNPIDGNACGLALYKAALQLETQGQSTADVFMGLLLAALNFEQHRGLAEGEVERAIAMLRTMPTRPVPIGNPIVAKGSA